MGWNKTQFELEQGTAIPESPPGLLNELNFTYTFQLKRDFSLSVRAGYGLYPFIYGYGDRGNPAMPNSIRYFDRIEYSSYLNLSSMLNYSHWLDQNWGVIFSLGGGVRTHASQLFYSTADLGAVQWGFNYNYGQRPKAFVLAETGIKRVLKNQDLIGLSLGCNFGIKEAFSGAYKLNLNNELSSGTMRNRGHYFATTLSYTITGARKWEYIETSFKEKGESFRSSRKRYKREKRYIDPASVFIGLVGGGSQQYSRAEKNDYFSSSFNSAGKTGITVQVGLGENRFLDLGIASSGYATGYKILGEEFNTYAKAQYLDVLELNAGYGLRIINNNGFNIIDLSAGVQLGVHNTNNEDLIYWNELIDVQYQSFLDESLVMDVSSTDQVLHNVFPLIYLKTGKNFRITKWLYFSANAQYNLGFYPIANREITYAINSEPPQQNVVNINMRGSGFQFMFGLSYTFIRKDK